MGKFERFRGRMLRYEGGEEHVVRGLDPDMWSYFEALGVNGDGVNEEPSNVVVNGVEVKESEGTVVVNGGWVNDEEENVAVNVDMETEEQAKGDVANVDMENEEEAKGDVDAVNAGGNLRISLPQSFSSMLGQTFPLHPRK
ncbi:hypothetical protein DEO72_LG10g328 [Vigna unguiculata]|uniref:PB1-like domain-containing protein n=1 Tax=Vigna unguiculata TaxID=3917 RepID=A0A4D6N9C5_VIGUN|nr:hypothetical protein DEO72_LG10g328 [Vigna unguiculata]